MKRLKHTIFYPALLAILLVCFFLPSSALAASRLGNDNHLDTDDYCLRAHDVTIGLSEFSSKSRAELENDILSASSFTFLIRDTVSGTGEFVPVTSGYSVDFSALTDAASSSGYVITVYLPPVSMSTDSIIQFRVFVEDDLPHSCAVQYAFSSGTPGHPLPAAVSAQLPAGENLPLGTSITPDTPFLIVGDGAGEWTFSGWSPSSATLTGSSFTFNGTWVWTALPTYTVSYNFISGSSGHELPSGVLDQLPPGSTGYNGDVITPPSTFSVVRATGGTWQFAGWNLGSQTISGGNVTFTGEWRWQKTKSAAAAPQADTSTPTLTLAPTDTAQAPTTPQTEQTPEQTAPVLEQIPDNPQPPAANSAAGGTAKMVVATVLTALVAAQAFAIASDLKVLKWYNAKKTARRAGA